MGTKVVDLARFTLRLVRLLVLCFTARTEVLAGKL